MFGLESWFSFLSLLGHSSIFSSPLDALWSSAKFAALGFALALAALIVGAKFKFFWRRNRYWNIAAKLYLLYIPIVCLGAGAGFGLLHHAKEINEGVVNVLLQPFKQAALEFLQDIPPEVGSNLSLPALKRQMQNEIELRFKDTDAANSLGDLINKLPVPFMEKASETLVNYVTDEFNKKISDVSGLDKENLSKLWRQSVTELLLGNFVNSIVSQSVNKALNSYQKTLLLLSLLLLLLPVADTLIARMVERRARVEKPGGKENQGESP
ncbi:MAG: hypothetical protein FWF20_06350 [Betaproteobacteria bacterium]|nr:hypothetical protein [Betaproteobacteria bacterium]MCL2886389.1 hypothetical protein [Betaproteobacteria bacterium]